jgi:hypothetical protein
MGYLLSGIIIFVASIVGFWLCLPGRDGRLKPFLQNGVDTWVAVAFTVCVVLGLGGIVAGIVSFL